MVTNSPFLFHTHSVYVSACDPSPPYPPFPPVCGLNLTGFMFVELLCDIHTAHTGPKEEGEEKKTKQKDKTKRWNDELREDIISQLTCLWPGAQSVLKLRCPVSKFTLCAPQGLVLSPLLLSLNFNDHPQQCHRIELQMYANEKIMLVRRNHSTDPWCSRLPRAKRLLYLKLKVLV